MQLNKEYTNGAKVNKRKRTSLYQVLLHNDDFTPMEFVIGILEKFFYMDRSKSGSREYGGTYAWKGDLWRICKGFCRSESNPGH